MSKVKKKKEYRISNKECRMSKVKKKKNEEGKKKNEYVKIEYRKKVRRRRGFFSQQSIMMPRHHPAPMKTGTNELAQHIGPPCHGVKEIKA
jgi:hypothetical protein